MYVNEKKTVYISFGTMVSGIHQGISLLIKGDYCSLVQRKGKMLGGTTKWLSSWNENNPVNDRRKGKPMNRLFIDST